MKYVHMHSFVNKYINLLEIRARRQKLLSRPVRISIEPTLKCNSNCLMCNRNAMRRDEDKGSGFLAWSILTRLKPFLHWTERVLFGGFGEPLLHPEYIDMLRYIKKQGPEVYFYTNGILLKQETSRALIEAGVDHISISFGGGHPETYRRIRGVEMDPIVENIRSLNRLRLELGSRRPMLSFNIVAMNSVLKEMDEIVRMAAALGVGEITMPNLCVQRPDLAHESPWLDVGKAQDILASAKKTALRHRVHLVPPDLTHKKKTCNALFKSLTVSWDGMILSCPIERFIIGDLETSSVEEIWNGPAMVQLRRRALKDGIESVCPGCFCWDNRPEAFLHPHPNSREFAQDLRKSKFLT